MKSLVSFLVSGTEPFNNWAYPKAKLVFCPAMASFTGSQRALSLSKDWFREI
jgi:hypothetical protein